MNRQIPPPEDHNPLRDSWRPGDKAGEAALDHPREFSSAADSVEHSAGPVPLPPEQPSDEDSAEKP